MKKLLSLVLAMLLLVTACSAFADAAEEQTPAEILAAAIDAALESGTKPADVFGEDAKAMLALYLPAGTDLDKLEIGAVSELELAEASDEPLDVDISASEQSGVVVVVFGDMENGYTSIPVETKVEDGVTVATLSPNMQQKLTEGALTVMTYVPNDALGAPQSKTVDDLTVVGTTDPKLTFAVGTAQNDASAKLIADMLTADYPLAAFDDATQLAVMAQLPEDSEPEDYTVNEVAPVECSGAVNNTTKVAVKLPTAYDDETNVASLFVGAANVAVPTKVVDGALIIDLTPEAAAAVANGGTLVVFND